MAIKSAFVLSGKYDLKDIDRVCSDFNDALADASIYQTEVVVGDGEYSIVTLHGHSTERSTHYTLKGVFAPPAELAVAIEQVASEHLLLGIINGGSKDGKILNFLKVGKVVY